MNEDEDFPWDLLKMNGENLLEMNDEDYSQDLLWDQGSKLSIRFIEDEWKRRLSMRFIEEEWWWLFTRFICALKQVSHRRSMIKIIEDEWWWLFWRFIVRLMIKIIGDYS